MIIIFCIKIPEINSDKFEIGKKYNAYHVPGLGYEEVKAYWVDDWVGFDKIFCQVSKEDFVTLEEFRDIQINKLI